MRTIIILAITHLTVSAVGFAAGIYALPILIAPPAPTESEIIKMSTQGKYSADFRKDLKDSDAFHWGEGRVTIGTDFVTFAGKLAPGPDYKLYLSTEFVETEADFERLKPTMIRIGDVKTFENFVVELKPGIDPGKFNTIIVWCETFGEFITAAKYL